jgi:primase-polymerase (primpol)-like protein
MPEWLLKLIRFDESPKGSHKPKVKQMAPLPTWAQMEADPEDCNIIAGLEAGKGGKQYQLLAEGDWRSAGYPTHSEADLALFNKLARLTNGEAGRMYAIFKETGLIRDHDDKSFSYYQRTIQKAIDGLNWRPGAVGSKNGRRL